MIPRRFPISYVCSISSATDTVECGWFTVTVMMINLFTAVYFLISKEVIAHDHELLLTIEFNILDVIVV